MASAVSPSSSPRLPSPPPIAEDQLGPKSPIAGSEEQQKLFSSLDHGASRRIRPGTKAEDMAEGPPLVDLSEVDSAFQLTEHLKALHNFLTHPLGSNSTIPVDREMAHKLAQPPENIDKTLWLYELCRFLTQKVNSIIIALFSDNPPCSSITCPEMRASEWQYLCAVHDPPKSCCAIDYCCHTLDWAANTLTSPKNFPSRLAMGTDQSTQHQQIRNLTNIFRRVYRIFAHAWFQHREMFWKVEGRTGLYILFKTVCDVYGLIPEDNYTIPPEAEGAEPSTATAPMPPPLILKREPSGPGPLESDNSTVIEGGDHTLSTAGTTKRHRHSPSVGATSVSTVVEENEEEAQEEDSAKEEPPTPASHMDLASEISDTPAEDTSPPEEPKISEEAESTDEAEPAAAEASQDAGEPEKQSASEDHSEPEKDGKEADAAAESATAEVAVPDEKTAEEVEPEAEEKSGPADPEKAEKDEATADPDKSAESE
ncbi:Mob1/phocein [Trematosphaeria pertusa]|uniref:Mob1/phocein n=1 Tax=Trematosphaeria pertusa TaxID=390896 RepID=A0A6A6HYH8_9PLEO|nr:Mob1/phocein [Trematosphaeria pertusa]KAF2242838.1 Mob1/phocein [Trematosphaeria pertusa]